MRQYSLRRLAWAGPLTAAATGLANLIYILTTRALGEKYLLPLDASGKQLTPMPWAMPVLIATALTLLAGLFFGVLIRYARKPVTVFLSVVVTSLILSFGGSFGIPGAAVSTKLLLSVLNVVTAVIMAGGLVLLSREKDSTRMTRTGE